MLSLFKRNPSTESAERAPAAHGKSAADIDHDASMRSIDSSAHSEAPTRRESSATASRASSTSLVAPGSPESATSEAISETFGSLDDLPHLRPIEQDGLSMHELAEAMIKDAKGQEYIVPIVSRMLTITVERNDRQGRRSNLESFEGQRAPVTISQYINRIVKYGGCSSCVFVVGLMYLNRLKRLDPSLRITSHNFQRLFLVAVMEASKFLDDHYYSNKHWAQIGGLTTAEINDLELEFIFRLTFNVTVTREEYDEFLAQITDADSHASRQRAERPERAAGKGSPESKAVALSPEQARTLLSGRSTPKRSPTVGSEK